MRTFHLKVLYFAPLVPKVLCDKRLTPFDRTMLSIMIQLTKQRGHCFATNSHFAFYLNCSESTVSKSINKMYKLGYIIENKPNPEYGGRGHTRRVREDIIYDPTLKYDHGW